MNERNRQRSSEWTLAEYALADKDGLLTPDESREYTRLLAEEDRLRVQQTNQQLSQQFGLPENVVEHVMKKDGEDGLRWERDMRELVKTNRINPQRGLIR